MDLRKPEGPRAELTEQLRQTCATILDERAQRHDLRLFHSAHHIKQVGLDALVGGDGESCDVVLPCREGLDRALPANRRMSLAKETTGCEVVERDKHNVPVL